MLTGGEAADLVDAFEQIFQLRFDQEVAVLRRDAGDGHITLETLDPLQRTYLRDSLRAISRVQAAVRKAWARSELPRL
jgi:signal-transduction protein with cAMP-binding, CBS, and nucleotidyltransferase domain